MEQLLTVETRIQEIFGYRFNGYYHTAAIVKAVWDGKDSVITTSMSAHQDKRRNKSRHGGYQGRTITEK